ncbi:MAG: alpha/beta hydrolase [Candidatus Zixiibacteriota bacterium]|nr:MAG: alpha/beta hydrolase [candidate division Zixibacteria bacterium]
MTKPCIRFAAAALLILTSCITAPKQDDQPTKTSNLLPIYPNVSLEIVEWGGSGTPMVFLAGLGHTAHVFDSLAPQFTDQFRVLGITRRGFGASSQRATGFTLDTLVSDLAVVLDSLDLDQVILVGHSLGGDEISRFAALHPDRLTAVIYLDGAYDRTTTSDTLANYPLPEINWPEPTTKELESAEGYRRYYERSNGVLMPLKEIEEIYNWNDDGSYAGGKTPGSTYRKIRTSLRDQVYEGIETPALAIYGVNYPVEELFLDYSEADSADQVLMMAYYEAGRRAAARSRERFRDEMKNGQVVEIEGAGHSLYITHIQQVEVAMRGFLKAFDRPGS